MKKILIIQPAVPPYRYGFFKKLDKIYEIKLIYSGKKWDEKTETTQLVVDCHSFKNIIFFQRFNFFKEVRETDIVLINGNIRYLSNFLILVLAKIFKKKLIWWGHLHTAGGNAYFSHLRHWISLLADYRLFYTKYEAEVFRKKFPKYSMATQEMSNGLDLDLISKFRKKYYPAERCTDILFCGRLTAKSKILFLLEAIAIANGKLSCVIIGNGVLEAKVRKKIKELNLLNVELIQESYDEANISKYFNNAKLFIYPGAAGLSIIHSQSYGVPVLVHDNFREQMPEISSVRDSMAGETFRFNDVKSLSDKITALLNNYGKLIKLSKQGEKVTRDTFNISIMERNFSYAIEYLRIN